MGPPMTGRTLVVMVLHGAVTDSSVLGAKVILPRTACLPVLSPDAGAAGGASTCLWLIGRDRQWGQVIAGMH